MASLEGDSAFSRLVIIEERISGDNSAFGLLLALVSVPKRPHDDGSMGSWKKSEFLTRRVGAELYEYLCIEYITISIAIRTASPGQT